MPDAERERAKKKLTDEHLDYGTPEDAIRMMCLEWLAWDRDNTHHVAALLLVEGTNSKNAYKAMENHARANRNGKTCVKFGPIEAMTAVMKYYGVTEYKAQAQLEDGLMYHLLMAEARKYQPYGTDHTDNGYDEYAVDDIDAWAARNFERYKERYKAVLSEAAKPTKATPVSDFNFGDFGAELEGLL